ncbi:hypothetical protein F8M41_012469 [Gigaspora margarita]|uniref:Uncharacterized protein n=1 Tax=Gigaspora margarita TaxID=4874 RepID=A0A8H4EPK1_GIGMA|nr:hypothetical protein F8M41_012469 [Gigaspora margarita]
MDNNPLKRPTNDIITNKVGTWYDKLNIENDDNKSESDSDFSDAYHYDEYDKIDINDEIDINEDYNNMDEYSDDTKDDRNDDFNIYDEFKSADEVISLFSTNFIQNQNVEYKNSITIDISDSIVELSDDNI